MLQGKSFFVFVAPWLYDKEKKEKNEDCNDEAMNIGICNEKI